MAPAWNSASGMGSEGERGTYIKCQIFSFSRVPYRATTQPYALLRKFYNLCLPVVLLLIPFTFIIYSLVTVAKIFREREKERVN
jgi:hypothetical protein